MATRTRNPRTGHAGTDWLASCAPDPTSIHRAWAREDLAPLAGGDRWRVVEADLMPSVAAMQRIGPGRLGPVMVYPEADLAWWLVPPGAAEELADLPRLTVRPAGWALRCPPAHRYFDGRAWLEKPDGSGRLTDPVAMGAAFGPTAGPRLPAEAFG
ncbi:hypothetical protein AB0M87_02725 [Streptomyces sp. NPDC051320]|uniref:hypothetical protein n=1 Tax=Streptomyces sp. NPDC051320 TaxID=3154644 RepID=UPI0034410B4F